MQFIIVILQAKFKPGWFAGKSQAVSFMDVYETGLSRPSDFGIQKIDSGALNQVFE